MMTFEGTFYYQMILSSVLLKYNSMKICYYLQNQLDCLTCMQAFLNGILLGQLTHVAMSHGYRHICANCCNVIWFTPIQHLPSRASSRLPNQRESHLMPAPYNGTNREILKNWENRHPGGYKEIYFLHQSFKEDDLPSKHLASLSFQRSHAVAKKKLSR